MANSATKVLPAPVGADTITDWSLSMARTASSWKSSRGNGWRARKRSTASILPPYHGAPGAVPRGAARRRARAKGKGAAGRCRTCAIVPPPRPSRGRMTKLNLTLLGGFQARLGEGPVLALPVKAQALLAYLALQPVQAHPRDALAALLWGDSGEMQARDNLRHTVAALRRALTSLGRPVLVVGESHSLTLGPAARWRAGAGGARPLPGDPARPPDAARRGGAGDPRA